MSTPMPPIYVFGEAMIELSDVASGTACMGVAGDTFNTAVYLSRNGMKVRYATALGDDSFSERILDAIRAEKIDTGGCVIIPGMKPGLYAIDLDETGERSFTYWRENSAARCFFETNKSKSVIANMKRAEVLYLTGITLSIFEEDKIAIIVEIVRSIRAAGGQVIFDTNYRPHNWKSKKQAQAALKAMMPHISMALLTWEDEHALFGDANPEETVARWHGSGVNEVIIKAGAQGVFASCAGWTPAPKKLNPIDTTGAGDSFNGAYLAARLSGVSIENAIKTGHELAAKVIMKTGAII